MYVARSPRFQPAAVESNSATMAASSAAGAVCQVTPFAGGSVRDAAAHAVTLATVMSERDHTVRMRLRSNHEVVEREGAENMNPCAPLHHTHRVMQITRYGAGMRVAGKVESSTMCVEWGVTRNARDARSP